VKSMVQRGKLRYSIGEVAQYSELSVKSLRYYDKVGLLKPAVRDASSGYRYYTEQQILKALSIRQLREIGFDLQEIRNIFNDDSFPKLEKIYYDHRDEVNRQIAELQQQLVKIDNYYNLIKRATDLLSGLDNNEKNSTDITLHSFAKDKCVYTRYRSRIMVKDVFWDRFTDIYKICRNHNLIMKGPMTAIFHEHYTHQFFFDDGDMEVLCPLVADETSPLPIEPDIIKEFGGFTAASLVHVGDYPELLPEYVSLIKWITSNGYEICGDPIEEYLVEFSQGVDASKYVTRVSFPVRAQNSSN
jgi:DNA-binding transcriptional MerR regulator/effector-binding domain-containing protein